MIASILSLSRADIKALRITDTYSLHRVVYSLHEDIRTEPEKLTSIPSGILYVDKGGDGSSRKILILSNRAPKIPEFGHLKSKNIPDTFLQHERYLFEIKINPTKRDNKTGKAIALLGREAITQWFIEKASKSYGFMVKQKSFQIQEIGVTKFEKNNRVVTHGSTTLKGELVVTDRDRFIHSFQFGIGRGRAFGFGLLQIVPLSNPFNL